MAGKLVFLGLGLVVGLFAGGGITWVVGSSIRGKLETQAEFERRSALETNRRALLERGWRLERAERGLPAEPLPADLVAGALESCEREQRDLPEAVGRRLVRERAQGTGAR